MNAITEMPTGAMALTDACVSKVKSLIDEEGNPDLKLRIFVTGGGCSGFQYGFTFDEEVADPGEAVARDGGEEHRRQAAREDAEAGEGEGRGGADEVEGAVGFVAVGADVVRPEFFEGAGLVHGGEA